MHGSSSAQVLGELDSGATTPRTPSVQSFGAPPQQHAQSGVPPVRAAARSAPSIVAETALTGSTQSAVTPYVVPLAMTAPRAEMGTAASVATEGETAAQEGGQHAGSGFDVGGEEDSQDWF